jgi:hypothetical protein
MVPLLKNVWRVVAFSVEDGTDVRAGVVAGLEAMGALSSGSLYQMILLWSSNLPSVPTAHWSGDGMLRAKKHKLTSGKMWCFIPKFLPSRSESLRTYAQCTESRQSNVLTGIGGVCFVCLSDLEAVWCWSCSATGPGVWPSWIEDKERQSFRLPCGRWGCGNAAVEVMLTEIRFISRAQPHCTALWE